MSIIKNASRFLVCLCLAMFVFCLAGCGEDYTPNFAGTWRVVSMEDSSGSDLTPVIEQLHAANKNMDLVLSDDKEKSASFDFAGQMTISGTWKPTGETRCSMSFEGYDEITATLDDGLLMFEQQGQSMSCQKVE